MVVVIPAFLSPDECDAIIKTCPPPEPGRVDHGEGASLSNVRKSHVSFLSHHVSDIPARVYAELMRINQRHYRFDVAGVEPMQVAEYGVGDEYGQHLDIGPGSASLRKLSASVQLSDPADYDGGGLEIFGCAPVDRDRGTLIVFPSYNVHWVAPVTRGRRFSLVAWAFGLKSFR